LKDKVVGYWCSMSWGLSARYHAKCDNKLCNCKCHKKWNTANNVIIQ